MNNEQPDRVPIRLFVEEFAAKYAGRTNYEAACDYRVAFDATRKCVSELGCDAAMSNAIVNWMGMTKAIGWKAVTFPGLGLPLRSVTQWTEPVDEDGAFLKAGEYDEFSDDPTAFLMNAWLPRFTEHIHAPGEPVTFDHNMALINGALSFLSYMGAFGKYARLLRTEAGVVNASAGTLKAPLDILGDKLRGYLNLCYDLNERHEKVKKACEALMPHLLRSALAGADPAGQVPVTIWMHRGGVPFVSRKDFEGIYWPTLRPIIEEIWAQGHQVLFYAEGNWDAHLESFAELPDRSIIFHVDRSDIGKVRRALGGRFCTSGGIPNDLLAIGTPERVRARCREVMDTLARDGGYILDASALIMDDAKVENVKAMVDASLDFGVYSQGSSSHLPKRVADTPHVGSGYRFAQSARQPGVCVPWLEKRKEFPEITGDENLARRAWEEVDSLGYSFLWTNLTW